jgi:hypothetical protein
MDSGSARKELGSLHRARCPSGHPSSPNHSYENLGFIHVLVILHEMINRERVIQDISISNTNGFLGNLEI